jgi:hypothetical protein
LMEMVPDVTEFPCESFIFAVKLNVPGVVVGEMVPLMLPVLLRVKPFGKLPELIVQLNGPTPPVSAKAVVG